VKDGVNGYLLAEVTAEAIARTIESIVAAPAELRAFAARSRATNFRLAGLYPRLNGISRETSSCFSN
jgi:DNA-binding NarL/FixJ family response regulator